MSKIFYNFNVANIIRINGKFIIENKLIFRNLVPISYEIIKDYGELSSELLHNNKDLYDDLISFAKTKICNAYTNAIHTKYQISFNETMTNIISNPLIKLQVSKNMDMENKNLPIFMYIAYDCKSKDVKNIENILYTQEEIIKNYPNNIEFLNLIKPIFEEIKDFVENANICKIPKDKEVIYPMFACLLVCINGKYISLGENLVISSIILTPKHANVSVINSNEITKHENLIKRIYADIEYFLSNDVKELLDQYLETDENLMTDISFIPRKDKYLIPVAISDLDNYIESSKRSSNLLNAIVIYNFNLKKFKINHNGKLITKKEVIETLPKYKNIFDYITEDKFNYVEYKY